MKKDSNSGKKRELNGKRGKSDGKTHRETKEVLAELVGRQREKLNVKMASEGPAEEGSRGSLKPNHDRLTVGVGLGDQWSNYCILDLEGETLAEGQLRNTQQDFAKFFQCLSGRGWWWRSGHTRLGSRKSLAIADTKWGEWAADGGIEASQA